MISNLKTIAVLGALLLFLPSLQAQDAKEKIPYGANPAAAHTVRIDDATIYYETYGSGGTPLVLLHGGLYGYIEEFGDLIEELSKHRLHRAGGPSFRFFLLTGIPAEWRLGTEDQSQKKRPETVAGNEVHAPDDRESHKNQLRPSWEPVYGF